MTDIGETIAPKSDQINADDLISGPRTIKITKVTSNEKAPDQPINIYYEGDNNKPYKPCKSMRRVMVRIWGRDGAKYPGRSMTLYCDPAVKFGGKMVGGIRISHMTGIDKDVTMALTETRASRKPFTVKRLNIEDPRSELSAQSDVDRSGTSPPPLFGTSPPPQASEPAPAPAPAPEPEQEPAPDVPNDEEPNVIFWSAEHERSWKGPISKARASINLDMENNEQSPEILRNVIDKNPWMSEHDPSLKATIELMIRPIEGY